MKGEPGDRYWVFMGDSPPVCVEFGYIGPDGQRIPDPVPSWGGGPSFWERLRNWWRQTE